MNDRKLTLEERVDLHRRMAESYHNAYDEKAVKEGATYNEWVFAVNCGYQIGLINSLSA